MTMQDAGKVDTTELDKQLAIIKSGRADIVQEFYDWLGEQGYRIAEWSGECRWCDRGVVLRAGQWVDDRSEVGSFCSGKSEDLKHHPHRESLVEIARQPERLMADHFGIDLDKIEQERRALLDAIRQED